MMYIDHTHERAQEREIVIHFCIFHSHNLAINTYYPSYEFTKTDKKTNKISYKIENRNGITRANVSLGLYLNTILSFLVINTYIIVVFGSFSFIFGFWENDNFGEEKRSHFFLFRFYNGMGDDERPFLLFTTFFAKLINFFSTFCFSFFFLLFNSSRFFFCMAFFFRRVHTLKSTKLLDWNIITRITSTGPYMSTRRKTNNEKWSENKACIFLFSFILIIADFM